MFVANVHSTLYSTTQLNTIQNNLQWKTFDELGYYSAKIESPFLLNTIWTVQEVSWYSPNGVYKKRQQQQPIHNF